MFWLQSKYMNITHDISLFALAELVALVSTLTELPMLGVCIAAIDIAHRHAN